MGKTRGQPQKNRLADMTVVPEPEPVWEPYREGTREEARTFDLLGTGNQIYQALYFDKGKVVDFVLKQEIDDDGVWREVLRVDCCHGEAHSHRFDADGQEVERKVLVKIMKQADVVVGLDKAEKMIYDKWQSNVTRWSRGR
jgi:hypothetical protein